MFSYHSYANAGAISIEFFSNPACILEEERELVSSESLVWIFPPSQLSDISFRKALHRLLVGSSLDSFRTSQCSSLHILEDVFEQPLHVRRKLSRLCFSHSSLLAFPLKVNFEESCRSRADIPQQSARRMLIPPLLRVGRHEIGRVGIRSLVQPSLKSAFGSSPFVQPRDTARRLSSAGSRGCKKYTKDGKHVDHIGQTCIGWLLLLRLLIERERE